MPKSKRACVFSTEFQRVGIDPRVKTEWEEAFGAAAPFAKLRQMWKTQHCVQVDPYNTGCPYPEVDCSLAFLAAVQRTAGAHPARPTGYFRAVSHSMGLDRADDKPLQRDMIRRTDVHKEGQPGAIPSGHGERPGRDDRVAQDGSGIYQGDGGGVGEESPDLRRSSHRPVRIGELLGAIDPRTRQRPTTDEQEGDK